MKQFLNNLDIFLSFFQDQDYLLESGFVSFGLDSYPLTKISFESGSVSNFTDPPMSMSITAHRYYVHSAPHAVRIPIPVKKG